MASEALEAGASQGGAARHREPGVPVGGLAGHDGRAIGPSGRRSGPAGTAYPSRRYGLADIPAPAAAYPCRLGDALEHPAHLGEQYIGAAFAALQDEIPVYPPRWRASCVRGALRDRAVFRRERATTPRAPHPSVGLALVAGGRARRVGF
jgi:hypothetical protein